MESVKCMFIVFTADAIPLLSCTLITLVDVHVCVGIGNDLIAAHSSSPEMMVVRPISAVGYPRPTSVFARMASQTGDPRYMV